MWSPKYDGKLGVGIADAGMIFLEDAGTAPGYGFGACCESHGKGARTGMDGSGRRQRVARSGVPADLYGRGIGKTEGKAPDTLRRSRAAELYGRSRDGDLYMDGTVQYGVPFRSLRYRPFRS